MAATTIPHFCNDIGVDKIIVGVKEFKCMGARTPYDHPHVFLDMGGDTEIICPYCSTLYVNDPALGAMDTDPPSCLVETES